MNKPATILAACFAATTAAALAFRAPSTGTIEVYFAPGPDCEAAIVREIDAADSIVGEFYELTSAAVGDAFLRAKQRGVDLQLILDENAAKANYSQAKRLAAAGVAVFLDGAHPIHHTKLLLIDGHEVVAGSYNPTNQAKKNAEQLQVQKHFPELAAKYLANWRIHFAHSYRLTAPASTSQPASPTAGGEGDTS